MEMNRQNRTQRSQQDLGKGQSTFEEVTKLKYLGILMTDTNDIEKEIRARSYAENRALRILLRREKLVYNSLTKPVVLYDSQTRAIALIQQERSHRF